MKQLSLLAGFLFCTTAVLAQRHAWTAQSMKPEPATEQEAAVSGAIGTPLQNQSRGGGIIFQEDFSDGFDGSLGQGAWTASDNQDGKLWIWVTPEGNGVYDDDSPTGSSHPGGVYSVNTDAFASTSVSNGWMIFDNDFWHDGPIGTDNPAVATEGALTSPFLDLSANSSVIISWESYFRYCCQQAAPLQLEVGSTEDGLTTWTSFEAHGDFIESGNALSANALSVSLDVSCAVANQDSVQFRFAYRQQNGSSAYSHYFWAIDDVVVTSYPEENDLEITQITNGDIFNFWEYRITPIEQAIVADQGGLVAGVMYKNAGTETQYNVEALVEILDADSTSIFNTTATIDTVYSFGQSPVCPPKLQDTLYISTGWVPSEVGNYSLRVSLISDGEGAIGEATPSNNVLVKDFSFTEGVYGHDDELSLNVELRPRESDDVADSYSPAGWGSFFHCPNPGSTAYGIAVKFGENTGFNLSGEPEPLEFAVRVHTLENSYDVNESPFEETYWVFNTPPNPTGDPSVETFLLFDDPIDLVPFDLTTESGNFYFASILSEFESGAQMTVLAESNNDTDYSCADFDRTSAGDYIWWTNFVSTPAIRLITSPFEAGCTDQAACNYDPGADESDNSCLIVGEPCNDGLFGTIDDVVTEDCECVGTPTEVNDLAGYAGLAMLESMPNPATTNAVIQFELMQSKEVSLELRSLQGKLVLREDFGALQAGLHRHDVDVSKLSAGQYTYSLVVDGVKLTRKLTVN